MFRQGADASAALLGLELGLEGRELGEGRIGVRLLVAFASRRIIAPLAPFAVILGKIRPLMAPLGTFPPPCRALATLAALPRTFTSLAALAFASAAKFPGRSRPPPAMAFGGPCGLGTRLRRYGWRALIRWRYAFRCC